MRLALIFALSLFAASASAQWEIQASHTTASLRGLHAIGNGVAWASGTDGTVLRTVNDGKDWQPCAVPPGALEAHLDFRGIQAFDANTAIVMSSGKGDLSRLYKTTDACRTWTLLFTNLDKEGFWDAIQFTDPKRFPKDKDFGMLLGDPVDGHFAVFLTFDRGDHWERQLKQAPEAQHAESIFAASNSSLIINRIQDRAFVTGGPSGARLVNFTTYNDDSEMESDRDAKVLPGAKEFYFFGKRRWGTSLLPMSKSSSAGGFSIAARYDSPDEIGEQLVIVGGDYQRPAKSEGSAIYFSVGSWKSYGWHPAATPPHGYRSSVAYDAPTKTWITVGPNGTDISTDDGRNWRALKPSPTDAPNADRDWNALSLPFVVGPHGRIGKLRPEALTAQPVAKPGLPTLGHSAARRRNLLVLLAAIPDRDRLYSVGSSEKTAATLTRISVPGTPSSASFTKCSPSASKRCAWRVSGSKTQMCSTPMAR